MNILICGIGGQGVVYASKILARQALERGETVHTAETIGMAQRGGSVVSHVRIGDDCHSPLIPIGGADVIIGLEPAETVRNIAYLKHGGTVAVSTRGIAPTTGGDYDPEAMLTYLKGLDINLIIVDAEEVFRRDGSYRNLNVEMVNAIQNKIL
ncbi:MAG: 2-oxoacid:acceptor oxidoreductase family protein [Oscillospiraceae bacterium]|jgi:indolepyruvate ferredoxin oxidoreductase beta subunit|nr:2-oxoacid:acceptor oxidoreductase family protein [Oscillospiraceae bacterium]